MFSYVVLLEVFAVVTTVLQFLSGAIICRKYAQKKSTGESSGFPFLCGFLSCFFWCRYGIFVESKSLILVNAIGSILFFIYSITYYVFTVNKNSFMRQAIFIFATLFCVVYYTNRIGKNNDTDAIQVMGVICCVVTVFFFAAPLIMLVHVIRFKNTESLPFPLIVMSFLVSVEWLTYGIIIGDTFIQIPNFLGCILSMLQLLLFVCYPPRSFAGQGYKLVVDQSVVF